MRILDRGLRSLSWASRLTKPIQNGHWICGQCKRTQLLGRSRLITTAAEKPRKPYYVTTPIFYVNAEPHVGHLYTIVLADILKRWQVLLSEKDPKLLTGTDEHGIKVQQAAAKKGLTPRVLCDRYHKTFQILASQANVGFNHFIRTTDPVHRDTVRHFWSMLEKAGYIYTSKHEGWYCVSEETFYPKSGIHAALDPATGRKMMACIETGKEVEWASETNYHFKLSAFRDRLLDFYRDNPHFIRPERYMKDVIQQVSAGLQDLSISRPVSRLTWGIPVPEDESQTIYVWLDALVNYLTYAGYPWAPGQEDKSIWPADVHVIGKDIVRFHCIFWPAFLMALDLPLPRQILTHAHWTLNQQKMSKSTGHVVNPNHALERFGVDTMRYYLAIDGGLSADSDYENSYIIARYKKNLQSGLGNLTSRLVRGKKWSVRDSISSVTQGNWQPNEADRQHQDLLESIGDVANNHMTSLQPGKTLAEVMGVIEETNKYFHKSEPWSSTDPDALSRVIYTTAESLRIAGILLQPFMPGKASDLLDMIGVAADKRNFQAAKFGFDSEYGVPFVPLKKGMAGTLFPPLESEE